MQTIPEDRAINKPQPPKHPDSWRRNLQRERPMAEYCL